jgi:CRISPR-associated protein Csd1
MSILASLVRAYDRLPDAPPFGFSSEKIGFLIALNADGTPAGLPIDLRSDDKKRVPRQMFVPRAIKRTAGIAPNFLWDKTSYVLGVTAGAGKRTADEHAAFVRRHLEDLAGTTDAGLRALVRFLSSWTPERFADLGWPEEMKDQNVVFCLESERRDDIRLHDRPAARTLWATLSASDDKTEAICLVTGERGPVARLHPAIKGVWGAQSSGASIVSFNLDAFTSYGHDQGDNAPVSEMAAAAYTTALNTFLRRDSGHVLQIGDASTVFWADASEAEARLAETYFKGFFYDEDDGSGPPKVDETMQARTIGDKLALIRRGVPLKDVEPRLAEGIRFFVLGLAPNAARLSIRFYFEDDFGVLANNYRHYVNDIRLETGRGANRPITIGRLVVRTAPARRDRNDKVSFDTDRVSSLLSGELLRAILTNGNYPQSLLPLLLMRIRSDRHVDHVRVALIKALIVRRMRKETRLPLRPDGTFQEDYLVRSDPNDPNPARRLGRLFALIERTQLASLGDEVNVTVKDKFLGAAAATPARVFPGLLMNAQAHLKRLRNGHSDAKKWIKDAEHARHVGRRLDRDIGLIWGTFNEGVPAQHSNEEQGLFLVGYYQERFGSKADSEDASPEDIEAANDAAEEE